MLKGRKSQRKARKLHDEERNDLYVLPTAIRVIKSSRERDGPGMWHAWGRRDSYRL